MYDLEDDIGLVAEDSSPAVAADNTALLNHAFENSHSTGKFRFRNGLTGPILKPITCAGKEFYFEDTIETSTRYGGKLVGAGGRVPLIPSGHYQPLGTMGGSVTRFTRIDGEKGGAVLRLRGVGFHLEGIQFLGRPFLFDPTGEGPEGAASLPRDAKRTQVGIEIEGSNNPPTGRHTIRDCSIGLVDYGICCRVGKYADDGKLVADENHADNLVVQGVVFNDVGVCLRTENEQAVCIALRDIDINGYGGKGKRPCVVIDCRRAGGVWADGVSINHPQSTLIRVGEGYSQWANVITARNVKWDRCTQADDHYRLFVYDGPNDATVPDRKWQVRVQGHLGYDRRWTPTPPDVSKIIDVPKGFPLEGLLFDVERLDEVQEQRFVSVPSGPLVRPAKVK